MFVDKDVVKFKIMGKTVYLYSTDTCYGRQTVADINDQVYYLGDEPSSIASAFIAWQSVNGRDLTNEELHQALVDNHLMSEGI